VGKAALCAVLERDQSAEVRKAAATALKAVGDAAAVATLKRACEDANEEVRAAASRALKTIESRRNA